MKFILATNNLDKIKEFKSKLISVNAEIFTPKDLGISNFEIDETEDTLEGNAFLKALAFYEKTGLISVSDDTGLFVEHLNFQPGVYSARYAGENCSYNDNCNKLLKELENATNRRAYFKTIICFYDGLNAHYLSGICEGIISNEKRGSQNFGYDPIFIPDGYDKTFAELDLQEKNLISHRGKALDNLLLFLKELKH